MKATDDVVTEAELFKDVFGCTDGDECPWHDGTKSVGVVAVCDGEWRKEKDGRWRFWEHVE